MPRTTREELLEALGAPPGATFVVRGPRFERPAGWPPVGEPPRTAQQWAALRYLPREELVALGFCPWDEHLMLLPGAWADLIPEGLPVESIRGEKTSWGPNLDRDTRYGCLSFGIAV